MATNTYAATAGTTLFYDDVGTADPSTALAGIKSFPGLPQMQADEFETTRVDQVVTAGGHDWFKQFAPDHVDPGELQAQLAFVGATNETLYGMIRQFNAWKIVFSNGDKMIFDGFMKTIGPEASNGDEVTVTVTIRVSGTPTYTKFTAP